MLTCVSKPLKRRGTDTPTRYSRIAQKTYSVWFAQFADRIGGKLATFTFANLTANVGYDKSPKVSLLYLSALSCHGIFLAPSLLLGKGKVSKTCTDVKESARGSASIAGVGRSKFMKCQKFV